MFFIGRRGNNIGIRKRSADRRIFLGPNSLKFVVLFVLAAFSLFYLSQSSQSATRNYIASDLEQQKKDVGAEAERLEIEANRLKALSLIQDKASEKGMEQVSK
jgi:hypothetical protein